MKHQKTLLFWHVKKGSVLVVQIDGVRLLATVSAITTQQVACGETLVETPVAITRGGMQFRLDNGVAVVPPDAWIVERLTPSKAIIARMRWAYNERDE